MVEIIDGKKLAALIKQRLQKHLSKLDKKPFLAVILVGEDYASRIYVRNKQKACEEVGIGCEIYHLAEDIKSSELKELISNLNNDSGVHGILVQLPLPQQIDPMEIISLIDVKKDVDGFSPLNAGLLALNSPEAIVPATPKGVLHMLQSAEVELSGKHAVVIGRSNIVGRPMAALLLNQDCTVTITHSKTERLKEICNTADIIISACGQAKMLKKDWVKKGAVIIDVGINRLEEGLCGDADFEEVSQTAACVSPVPGGVGPMTIAMLLDNLYEAFQRQK